VKAPTASAAGPDASSAQPAVAAGPALRLDNLVKRCGPRTALAGLSLQLPPGRFVALLGTVLPGWGSQTPTVLLSATASALMLGALGLLLSVHLKQLENFAGTMTFVFFPMGFMSTALCPLWKLQESGAEWVCRIAQFNPYTHAVAWMRLAPDGKDAGASPWLVLGTFALCFLLAAWGYDPQRGFGHLAKRGRGSA
jgi:ABC-2 type transport system permease protein